MNKVYWLHYPSHTDPAVEGYIGVTNNLEYRMKVHRKTFKEYFDNGALVTVLHEVMKREDAMLIEADYRPQSRIGWNTHPGSLRRLNPPKPVVSTSGNTKQKMVNMRIDPDFWYRFKMHCQEEGCTMTSRIQELMQRDMDGDECHHQYDLFK
jgi:predicted GIY-YIG superfamily endonuclease